MLSTVWRGEGSFGGVQCFALRLDCLRAASMLTLGVGEHLEQTECSRKR